MRPLILSLCDYTGNAVKPWIEAGYPGMIVDIKHPKGYTTIEVVASCAELCEESGNPYIIENPVSTLSTYWRKPDYSFDPYEFAGYCENALDLYVKRTCLWIGNGVIIPDKKSIPPLLGEYLRRLPPTKDRPALRSVTPLSFAHAIFYANEEQVKRRSPSHQLGKWV